MPAKVLTEGELPIAIPFETVEEAADQAVLRMRSIGVAQIRLPVDRVGELAKAIADRL